LEVSVAVKKKAAKKVVKKKAAPKRAAKKTVVCRDSSLIKVDCEANCQVDIRCGGARYLGYDFFFEKGQ